MDYIELTDVIEYQVELNQVNNIYEIDLVTFCDKVTFGNYTIYIIMYGNVIFIKLTDTNDVGFLIQSM